MILIIGLGNPGEDYQNTRHNAGWLALEKFRSQSKENFSEWQEKKKFQALVSESGNKTIKLVLPQTFMNNSGEAVSAIAKFYKVPIANIWAVHDDLDLPIGKIKIQIDRGAAGHNGIKSIIEKLGSQNFVRFRIGIKPTTTLKKSGSELVLKKFLKTEQGPLQDALHTTTEALEFIIENGLEKTMNKFNT